MGSFRGRVASSLVIAALLGIALGLLFECGRRAMISHQIETSGVPEHKNDDEPAESSRQVPTQVSSSVSDNNEDEQDDNGDFDTDFEEDQPCKPLTNEEDITEARRFVRQYERERKKFEAELAYREKAAEAIDKLLDMPEFDNDWRKNKPLTDLQFQMFLHDPMQGLGMAKKLDELQEKGEINGENLYDLLAKGQADNHGAIARYTLELDDVNQALQILDDALYCQE